MATYNRFERLALAATLSILTCTQLTVRTVGAQGAPGTTPPPAPVTSPAPELAPLTDGATVTSGTQVIDVSQLATPGVLSLDGNLHNTGELFLISTNSSITSAILSAANIVNFGTISTALPQSLAVPGALSSLNLVLSATSSTGIIWNAGIISSSASLTMNAQTIVNALPAGITGPTPLMQAVGNLNISGLAAAINAGTIQSINGNININTASQIAQSISFNSTNGLVEALNGSINFRDSSFGDIKEHLNILGGDFLGQEMNLHSGTGILNAQINNSDGYVNSFAGEIFLRQASGSLSLGDMVAKGDPWVDVDGVLDIGRNNQGDPVTSIELTQQFATLTFSASKIRNSGLASITTNGGAVGFFTDFELDLASAGVALQIKTNGGEFNIYQAGNITFADGTVIDTSGHAADSIGYQNDVYIRATGSIDAPNLKITTGGGDVSIFGGAGYAPGPPFTLRDDFCCSISMPGAEISTTGESGADYGRVSIGSLSGSILMPGSKIEAGNADVRMASASSIEVGDIDAPGAAVEIMSGTRIYWSIVNGIFDFGTADERNFGGNLTTGAIDTSNITGIGGNITLISFQGDLTASELTSNGGTVALQAFGDLTGTTITTSSSDSGGVVTVDSGHGVTISDIFANGREGGSVFLAGNIHGEEPSFELETGISARGTEQGGLVSVMSSTDLSADTSLIDIGTSAGKGGTIGFAAGGNLTVTGELSAKSDDGNGGAVYLSAGTTMTLPATIDVSGTGDGRGGDVVIFTSQGEFTSSIFATGTSGGGNINIYGSGDLTLNSSNWDISTTTGFGGTVLVEAGGNLSVQGDLRAVSQSGSGGVVSLTSQAAINVSGIIDVSATSSGTGGQVYILSAQQGQLPSTILATGIDGGGRIDITSGGDLVVDAQNLNVNTVTGTGGHLSLTAGGELVVSGTIAALSQNGDGGSILLSSGGSMSLPSLVNASATAQGAGGAVSITTAGTTINASGTVAVLADGAGTGGGGSVEVTFRTSGSTAESSLFARSGTEGGDGGAISLSSQQGDLSVDPHDWNISIRGDAGNGGALKLSSKDGQIILAEGTVSANGKGSGSGGSVTLSASGSGSAINIGTGVKLRANGASGGSIKLNSDGDLTVGVDGLRANAVQQDGNGGLISVNGGKVTINGNFQANGRGTGNGGSIVVTSTGTEDDGGGGVIIGLAAFSAPAEEPFETGAAGEPETIEVSQSFQANAGTVGYGGLISIQSETGSIELGGGSTLPSFLANGGTQEGDGGNIQISSASDLSITANQLSASARGSGNGGSVSIVAEGGITVDGKLYANANTSGGGGSIWLQAGGDTKFTGSLAANAKGDGDAGSIELATTGNLTLSGGAAADAGLSGNGGTVNISAGTFATIAGTGGQIISARGGTSNGDGGTIQINGDSGIELSLASLSTRSRGESGNGGKIKFTTEGNAQVSSAIDASARATQGDGGHIDFLINGDTLTVNGSIDFSAQTGNAGTLVIDPDEATVINGDIIGNAWVVGNGGSFEPPAQSGSFTFGKADLRGGKFGGNGGRLKLVTDTFIQITGKVDTSAAVGNSGSVHLEAGGRVQTGTIDVSAPVGQVGSILIKEKGDTPFIIGGTGASNGVNGSILMNGLLSNLSGGEDTVQGSTFLAIIDQGTAGITLHDAKVQNRIVLGTGVFIVLDSENGQISLPNGIVNDGIGSNIAGSIWLNSDTLDVQGNGLIRAGGTASGTGGQVFISSGAITFGSTLSASANGGVGGRVGVTGRGGMNVSVESVIEGGVSTDLVRVTYLQGSDLMISGSGNALFAANGLTSAAGEVNLESTGNVTLSGANFTVAARGVSGDAKGSEASVQAGLTLNLQGTSHLSVLADGSGDGKGGQVLVVAGNDLNIGTGAGRVSTDASGGDTAAAGIVLIATTANITADGDGIRLLHGDGDHDGGRLTLTALAGKIDVADDFTIAGSGTGKGGTFRTHANEITFQSGARVTVDGGKAGAGGLIDLIADAGGIQLGTARLSAQGGVDGGNGGVIFLTSSGEITQDATGSVNASSRASGQINAAGTIAVRISEAAQTPLKATINGLFSARNGSGGFGNISFSGITNEGAVDISLQGSTEIDGNLLVEGRSITLQDLRAPEVKLIAHKGAIGNSTSDGKLATDRLIFEAVDGIDQNVSIRLFEGQRTGISAGFFSEVQILSSKATGNVSITVEPEEAVSIAIGQIESGGSVFVDSSNIHLPSSKPITVFSALGVPATINARDNITLQGSTITFLNGAKIQTVEGFVRVFAGGATEQFAGTFQESQQTPSLTIDVREPYYVAFGTNGIYTGSSVNNQISAIAGTVSLSTSNSPASAITLNGNVVISAGTDLISPPEPLIPIGCVNSQKKPFPILFDNTEQFLSARLSDARATINGAAIELETGSLLIAARKLITITSDDIKCVLPKAAVVLATKESGCTTFVNLAAAKVIIEIPGNRLISLEPGQQFSVRDQCYSPSVDKVARRRVIGSRLPNGKQSYLSEVSLPSLFSQSHLLKLYKHAEGREHQRVVREILKMGAALLLVTSGHGPYRSD